MKISPVLNHIEYENSRESKNKQNPNKSSLYQSWSEGMVQKKKKGNVILVSCILSECNIIIFDD